MGNKITKFLTIVTFCSRQSEWLMSWLDKYSMDSAETLKRNTQQRRYSLRQAIRHYLENDVTRRLLDKWEPAGVFFEKCQLTWRDCFFLLLSALAVKCGLLTSGYSGGTTSVSYKSELAYYSWSLQQQQLYCLRRTFRGRSVEVRPSSCHYARRRSWSLQICHILTVLVLIGTR